jgi:hypothetical protein
MVPCDGSFSYSRRLNWTLCVTGPPPVSIRPGVKSFGASISAIAHGVRLGVMPSACVAWRTDRVIAGRPAGSQQQPPSHPPSTPAPVPPPAAGTHRLPRPTDSRPARRAMVDTHPAPPAQAGTRPARPAKADTDPMPPAQADADPAPAHADTRPTRAETNTLPAPAHADTRRARPEPVRPITVDEHRTPSIRPTPRPALSRAAATPHMRRRPDRNDAPAPIAISPHSSTDHRNDVRENATG